MRTQCKEEFLTISQVFKNQSGTAYNRYATVMFSDCADVLYPVDCPYYKPGTRVFVGVRESDNMTYFYPVNDESDLQKEAMQRFLFYEETRKILSFYDYEEIFSLFPNTAYEMYKKNPYFLFNEDLIPFSLSSSVTPAAVSQYFIPKTFLERKEEIIAYANFVLKGIESNGNTGGNLQDVVKQIENYAAFAGHPILNRKDIKENVKAILMEKTSSGAPSRFVFVGDEVNGMIFRRQVFEMEKETLRMIQEFSSYKKPLIENDFCLQLQGLGKSQKNAVKNALFSESRISIITGGPGTGKTHTINSIIRNARAYFNENGYEDARIQVIAPTGRASKRFEEGLTGDIVASEARLSNEWVSTIHKFIGLGKEESTKEELRKKISKTRLIIVDESSMVGLYVFYNLIQECINYMPKIILVGDEDQLPSVDMGNIFSDLISLGIPTFRLTENFRSSDEIITVSKEIKEGNKNLSVIQTEKPEKEDPNGVYFVEIDENNPIELLESICNSALENIYESQYPTGLILLPNIEGVLSTSSINEEMEEIISDYLFENEMLEIDESTGFRIGSPVIICKTNYHTKTPYMNGTMGTYLGVNTEGMFCVKEPGFGVYETLGEIVQSHAITIHKSQGSEADTVFVIIPESNKMMTRKLLYTAVTRAKKKVVIFSTKEILDSVIENVSDKNRKTYMSMFAKGYVL